MNRIARSLSCGAAGVLVAAAGFSVGVSAGCAGYVPSDTMERDVRLPIPASTDRVPPRKRLLEAPDGATYILTPRSLIDIAFDHQPDIKSSYQRFKSEEARYDFFYTSRDALTPRLSTSNTVSESRMFDQDTVRTRSHNVEFGLEKLFFDTTELDVAVGYDTSANDDNIGNRPFASASLRYPLWVSRQKLARTSEDIFRRNDLNDAQLGYIQEVRQRLQQALFRFHDVVNLRKTVEIETRRMEDLRELLELVRAQTNRDVRSDAARVEAEISSVAATVRNETGRFEFRLARLKAAVGIEFHAKVELRDEEFNPFQEGTHEDWLLLSIETDPEIATLQNEVRNAEVQLDLARRGKWDFTLLLDGRSNFEGRGESEGDSDWSVSTRLDVTHVDSRVTDSLARQAMARIQRFKQAIVARENDIFVGTLEPMIRIETVGQSYRELLENLPRYQKDYDTGVAKYLAGKLNIDDLVRRRRTLAEQEREVARNKFLIGVNIAELCSATGKFFDLLEQSPVQGNAATNRSQ